MARVFVQNTNGFDIAVFDDRNNYEPCGRLSLGGKLCPNYLFLSKDQSLLYSNWADLVWVEPGYPGGARSLFTAHDPWTLEEKWRVEVPSSLDHWALHPSGRYAFCSVFERMQVVRVDLETRELAFIGVDSLGGHGIKVSKDGRFCYGSSVMTGDFWEIDTETLKRTRTFGFPAAVRPFALTQDGRYAFVQNSHLHGFHKFDLKDWRIVDTIQLPDNPPGTPVEKRWPFTVDHGMYITKGEKYVVCLATTGNEVYFLDFRTFEVKARIKVGVEPSYLVPNPAGDKMYVTSRASNEFHVIDIETLSVVANVKNTGNKSQRICVTS